MPRAVKRYGVGERPKCLLSADGPLLASESLFHTDEGSVTVDGIVMETLNDDPILLIQGREYLIAADLHCEGKIITPVAMVDGIFRVEDTKLKPLGDKNRRLVGEVERMYNNNLSSLRSDLQSRLRREKYRSFGLSQRTN